MTDPGQAAPPTGANGDGGSPPAPTPGTSVAGSDDVVELHRRIGELEAQNAALLGERAASERRRRETHRARTALAITLVVLGALLAPLSVIAVWARGTVSNTDQYVATVAPLATNPAIQATVSTRVTDAIYNRLDVPAVVAGALPPKAQVLTEPISNGVKNFIGTVTSRVVRSPRFAAFWEQANRAAHAQLVAALEGRSSAGVSVSNDKVTLDLAQLVDHVKARLSAAGLTVVDKIPTSSIRGTVTLFQSNQVGQIQGAYSALQKVGIWTPVIAAALLVAGVLLAPRRRRATAWAAFGVLVTVLLCTIAFFVVRHYYLANLPPQVTSRAAASAAFDITTRFLRQSARALAALAVVVWVVAFVGGPARGAATVRHAVTAGAGGLGDRAESAGLLPTPMRLFVGRSRRWLQIADVALIVLILLLWSHRSGADVIWMALLGLFLLLVIEFVGVRTPPPATAPAHPPAPHDGATPGPDGTDLRDPPGDRPGGATPVASQRS